MPSVQATERSPSSRRRDVARDVGWLVLSWILVAGGVIAVGLALTGPLDETVGVADDDVARWLADHRSSWLTTFANVVTLLGDTWVEVVLSPILALGAWLWWRKRRAVAFLTTVVLGEVAVYLLVVNVVSRHRPPVRQLDPGLDPNHSFPSGHVAAAVAMYGGMAVLIGLLGDRRWRWLVPLLVLLPPSVAIARLYLGAHHVSDVVTSLVYMSVWLAIAAAVLLRDSSRPSPG